MLTSAHRPLLMKKMEEVGIEIYTDCTCNEVKESGVICSEKGEDIVLKGDTVVAALGLKANTSVVDELRDAAPQFAAIGNCVRPDTITFACYIRAIMRLSIFTQFAEFAEFSPGFRQTAPAPEEVSSAGGTRPDFINKL